jgi:mutator protein MutT
MNDQPQPADAGPALFRVSAAVYAQRDGEILILKRAGGELTGAWDVPGGMVDAGETAEEAARRELVEEAGIVPSGPLTLVGLVPMHVYGHESFRAMYACDCPDGEVVISHEHSGYRWIDPRDYRERYFGDEQLARVAEGSERRATIVRNVQANLDEYIAWLQERAELTQLRTARRG